MILASQIGPPKTGKLKDSITVSPMKSPVIPQGGEFTKWTAGVDESGEPSQSRRRQRTSSLTRENQIDEPSNEKVMIDVIAKINVIDSQLGSMGDDSLLATPKHTISQIKEPLKDKIPKVHSP